MSGRIEAACVSSPSVAPPSIAYINNSTLVENDGDVATNAMDSNELAETKSYDKRRSLGLQFKSLFTRSPAN